MAAAFFDNRKFNEMIDLEKKLGFLLAPDMDTDAKLKALEDSFWRAHNASYCDYIAGQRMAGIEDTEVKRHDNDCKYKEEVGRLIELLNESKSDIFLEDWQRANDLFEADKEAGYNAWLELSRRGYVRAFHSVGWCLANGYGVEKNLQEAKKFYTLAIDGGYTDSYDNLYFVCKNLNEPDEVVNKILLRGVKKDNADCYEILSSECQSGNFFGNNSRVVAFLATRAYELDRSCCYMLTYCYLVGCFFPQVYTYAKYCMEGYFSTEDFEAVGIQFPEFWDEIEPQKPEYPDFNMTVDDCENAVDPEELILKAQKFMFAEVPNDDAAKPLVNEAAALGYSRAMYYAWLLDLPNAHELLIKGADEYGDLDCIENIAILFSENAIYRIGNPYLTQATKYWVRRKTLHGGVPMNEMTSRAYDTYAQKLDRLLGIVPREIDPNANAVLLRADGSFEKIKVDFDSLEGLYAPIGCDRLNIISTQGMNDLSDKLGFTVVMYCDERGMQKELPENELAARISGYEVIWGDVVICGFTNDYAPLYKDEVVAVCEFLKDTTT